LQDRIDFFYPGALFTSVSVTGSSCWLGCKHCKGHYLEGMIGIERPSDLMRLALDLEARGGRGFLLSGGCLPDGTIPLGPFLETLRKIKRITDLRVNVHAGILDHQMATRLVGTGADRISLDLVQDPAVLRGNIGPGVDVKDYESTLHNLLAAGGSIVPHFVVGMPHSSPEGERKVLELLVDKDVKATVILGFIPTPGTPSWTYPEPTSERMLDIIVEAVERLHHPIILGCMRSRRDRGLERRAIEAGVSGVAVPSSRTVSWADGMGMQVRIVQECCALY
jgi:uncharacterized radical SAM superfamily protein